MYRKSGCGTAAWAAISIVVVVIVSSIANGFALKILWGWFVASVFGVPALTIVQAIGISALVGYLTYQPSEREEGRDTDLDEAVVKALITAIFRPASVLGFGWIVHLFM